MTTQLIKFEATSFTMFTTNEANVRVATQVQLSEDSVPIEYVAGALTAGSTPRTRWQNSLKASKKQKALPIPQTLAKTWGEWIGRELAPTVVQVQVPLTEAQIIEQMLSNPEMFERMMAQRKAQQAHNAVVPATQKPK